MKTAAVVFGALLLVFLFCVTAEAVQEDLDMNALRMLLQDEAEVSMAPSTLAEPPLAGPADAALAPGTAEGPLAEEQTEDSGAEYGIHASRWLTVLSAVALLYVAL